MTNSSWLATDRALAEAASVGVTRIVQIGCDLPGARWAVQAAQRYDVVVAAVALHPNEAPRLASSGELDEAFAEIETLAASSDRVRAVGETGLDYFRTEEEGRDAQHESFRRHIDLAKRLNKTLVIHDRDSHADVIRLLDEEGVPERVVMHCFSGDAAFARECLDRGAWLSFSGTVTFKNAQPLRDALAVTPLDRILVAVTSRPGSYHHWRTVRSKIALLTKSRAALAVMIGAVAMALVATTAGYAAMTTTVTLSVDGKASEIGTMSNTVGEVLESEGISVGDHDVVAPGLDSPVNDGTRIAVRFGRPLDISIDGKDKTYWVTATDVEMALDQLGLRYAGAQLSASRSSSIGRDGLDLAIVTAKNLTVKVGKDDKVRPKKGSILEDGDKIVVTRVRTVTRRATVAIDFETIEKSDSTMYTDQSRTVRLGRDGSRNVLYRITFENGKRTARIELTSSPISEAFKSIVRVGTKERPVNNFAGGSSVWDELADCESGGNWAANTGNGYYGGLQFNVSTWQSYGGTGYPHEASRETQIAIATKVRDANGGYGSWPACSQQMGLLSLIHISE